MTNLKSLLTAIILSTAVSAVAGDLNLPLSLDKAITTSEESLEALSANCFNGVDCSILLKDVDLKPTCEIQVHESVWNSSTPAQRVWYGTYGANRVLGLAESFTTDDLTLSIDETTDKLNKLSISVDYQTSDEVYAALSLIKSCDVLSVNPHEGDSVKKLTVQINDPLESLLDGLEPF